MNSAYLSALSALAGSVIGGLMSAFTTWLNQRAQARVALLTHQLSLREDLFREFIVAASKAYAEACISDQPQIPELITLYGMVSRMRVLCNQRTVACAEAAIGAYHVPNKTVDEVRAAIMSGSGIDPLREFAEAAREELRAIKPAR